MEDGPRYWYLKWTWRQVEESDGEDTWTIKRRVQVPDSYCKSCRNKLRSENRRTRKLIDALPPEERLAVEVHRQGLCECCGRRMRPQCRKLSTSPITNTTHAVCFLCDELIEQSTWDVDTAKATWLEIRQHLADERALDRRKEERCPGVRRPFHAENPNAPEIPHVQCITLERHWRAVIKFLTRQRTEVLTPAL